MKDELADSDPPFDVFLFHHELFGVRVKKGQLTVQVFDPHPAIGQPEAPDEYGTVLERDVLPANPEQDALIIKQQPVLFATKHLGSFASSPGLPTVRLVCP